MGSAVKQPVTFNIQYLARLLYQQNDARCGQANSIPVAYLSDL
jgi:hypothetical protein